MKHTRNTHLRNSLCLLVAFVLWTVALCFVDVAAIGPLESAVGFSTLNGFVHDLTGVHLSLYDLTDRMSLIPLCFVAGFGCTGLVQWIKRKHLLRLDAPILALGGFYILVAVLFILFEFLELNYRPVLIEGVLEASYPSSTTMLAVCVMSTGRLLLQARIRNRTAGQLVSFAITAFTAFMVLGRLLSGVHWFTDIVGGLLLSQGLVQLYRGILTNM